MQHAEPLLTRAQPLRYRGIALTAARAFVKERFGPDGWARFLAGLDEPAAAFWDSLILPDQWYSARLLDEVLDALRALDGERIGEPVGRRIVSADIRNRMFLPTPVRDPAQALDEGPRLWRAYVNAGALQVIARAPGRFALLLDNPGVHRLVCGGIVLGWGNEIVARAGGRVLRNRHRCCHVEGGTVCRYDLTWADKS